MRCSTLFFVFGLSRTTKKVVIKIFEGIFMPIAQTLGRGRSGCCLTFPVHTPGQSRLSAGMHGFLDLRRLCQPVADFKKLALLSRLSEEVVAVTTVVTAATAAAAAAPTSPNAAAVCVVFSPRSHSV